MRHGNNNTRRHQNNNRGRGQQGQGRSNNRQIAQVIGQQVSREVGKAIGQLSSQLSKTLRAGQPKPQQGKDTGRGRKTHGKANMGKDVRNGRTKANQDKQARGNKGKQNRQQVWVPSAGMNVMPNDKSVLLGVCKRLATVVEKSVTFKAPIAEVQYEISKHLTESSHSDAGKVEVAAFRAELANEGHSYPRIATAIAIGALPIGILGVFFPKASKDDIRALGILAELHSKMGIMVAEPFTHSSSRKAAASAINQLDSAMIARFAPKTTDPFELVSAMVDSDLGWLCKFANTSLAEVNANARSREANMAVAGPSTASSRKSA